MSSKPERPFADDRDPWESQPWEGQRAAHAFRVYRDLGSERSLAKLSAVLGLSTASRQGFAGHLSEWSRLHRWQERIGLYEAAMDHERLVRRRDALIAAEERQRDDLEQIAAALRRPVRAFLERVRQADDLSSLPLDEHARIVVQIGRALPRLAQAERLVYGLSTANVGGHDGGPSGASSAVPADAVAKAAEKTESELEAYLAGIDAGRAAAERDGSSSDEA
jgi:hypothetical protein